MSEGAKKLIEIMTYKKYEVNFYEEKVNRLDVDLSFNLSSESKELIKEEISRYNKNIQRLKESIEFDRTFLVKKGYLKEDN